MRKRVGRLFVYVHVTAMILLVVYILFLVYAPIFLDGSILSASVPFAIDEGYYGHRDLRVHMEFHSQYDMEGVLTSELVCESGIVVLYDSGEMHLNQGCNKLVKYYTMPDEISSTCKIRGRVYYSPFTNIGPRLHLDWFSVEIFPENR